MSKIQAITEIDPEAIIDEKTPKRLEELGEKMESFLSLSHNTIPQSISNLINQQGDRVKAIALIIELSDYPGNTQNFTYALGLLGTRDALIFALGFSATLIMKVNYSPKRIMKIGEGFIMGRFLPQEIEKWCQP